ncbi:MAG: hypothetical protein M5U22_17590 [Thermoleophilia bacterium]|nr:hypothetical protein [Thermoleophilia bacterium]
MDLESAYGTAEALADRSRLRTLHALRPGTLCVEELARARFI